MLSLRSLRLLLSHLSLHLTLLHFSVAHCNAKINVQKTQATCETYSFLNCVGVAAVADVAYGPVAEVQLYVDPC